MARIIYQEPEGNLAIIIPVDETLDVTDIALKDVPAGLPYLIVEDDAIPSDRSFRNAWEADFSNPDGYGIGPEAWFAAQEV